MLITEQNNRFLLGKSQIMKVLSNIPENIISKYEVN